jgi:hypothetical protein
VLRPRHRVARRHGDGRGDGAADRRRRQSSSHGGGGSAAAARPAARRATRRAATAWPSSGRSLRAAPPRDRATGPAEIVVRLDEAAPQRLSVGSPCCPCAWSRSRWSRRRGSRSRATASRTASRADDDAARRGAERLRVARLIEGDARVVTEGDVRDAVALAEPDLFRTLQRLPGVAARDDYAAGLWTARRAVGPDARVLFDDVPLFNPLHAAGMVSAVNTDALGGVVFHPGVQRRRPPPARRRPCDSTRAAAPRPTGRACSANCRCSAAAWRSTSVARRGRVVHGRAAAQPRRRGAERARPRARDARRAPAVRVRRRRRAGRTSGSRRLAAEASALGARDALWGDVPGLVAGTRARWGERRRARDARRAGRRRHAPPHRRLQPARRARCGRTARRGTRSSPASCGRRAAATSPPPAATSRSRRTGALAGVRRVSWSVAAGASDDAPLSLGARLVRQDARFTTSSGAGRTPSGPGAPPARRARTATRPRGPSAGGGRGAGA